MTPQIMLKGKGIMVGLVNVCDKITSAFSSTVRHWCVYCL